MAVIPLLPGGAQEWIADFQHGVRAMREVDNTGSQNPRPTSTPRPTTSALPTRTPRPTHTPSLTTTPRPTPTLGPTSTPRPTPTPTSTPLPTPTPTPLPPPDQRHYEYKLYMLELINEERENAGVGPVTMGNNFAAQLHAENALDACFGSHWGVDGLKPYMRYSLAGGYQSNGENGSGSTTASRHTKAIAGWTA